MKWGDIFESVRRFDTQAFAEWLFSADMASETVAALVVFFVGWVTSLRISRQRRKDRIIDELILSQRELLKRAYPQMFGEVWRADGERKSWMMDPFVARIEFLIASMREDRAIALKHVDLLDNYVKTKRDFIEKWTTTKHRRDSYHEAYKVSYFAMRAAAMSLGLRQMKRLSGLLPPHDLLEPAPVVPQPQAAE